VVHIAVEADYPAAIDPAVVRVLAAQVSVAPYSAIRHLEALAQVALEAIPAVNHLAMPCHTRDIPFALVGVLLSGSQSSPARS